ncbi:MAG: DUF5011 domain-containing protein [Bacilli bacterium]|nr:DUF5011 domain-containing protein [Bacilli bacterium]MDD4608020.1 DUF5011 domain-containing protein [Bacilli bacterium]
MKKNGFTLIEVLGVIIILSLLSLIAIPAIEKQLQNGKDKFYDIQIKTIEASLKDWKADNLLNIPKYHNNTLTITLYQLKQAGKIDADLVNPKTNQSFPDDMLLKIKKVGKIFEYEVVTDSGSNYDVFDNDKAPKIELIGEELVYVTAGNDYVELGVTATYANGEAIEGVSIEISGSGTYIDTTKSGEYTVKYSVTDNNLTASIIRTVIVVI